MKSYVHASVMYLSTICGPENNEKRECRIKNQIFRQKMRIFVKENQGDRCVVWILCTDVIYMHSAQEKALVDEMQYPWGRGWCVRAGVNILVHCMLFARKTGDLK
jgi:hypothetical protein